MYFMCVDYANMKLCEQKAAKVLNGFRFGSRFFFFAMCNYKYFFHLHL